MYYTSIDLRNINDDSILIKLPRSKIIKIFDFYLLSTWDGKGDNELTIYIDLTDKKLAKEYLKNFIEFLCFMYNMDLTSTTNLTFFSCSEPKKIRESVISTNNSNIKKICSVWREISSKSSDVQSLIVQSIHYFSRSLKLSELELYEEAYLTVFKPIELISNNIYTNIFKSTFYNQYNSIIPEIISSQFNETYTNQGTDKEIRDLISKELKKLITLRRKINLSLEHLKLDQELSNSGNLVKIRNSIGAHANSGDVEIGIYEYTECMLFSKAFIDAFIFNKPSGFSNLDISLV